MVAAEAHRLGLVHADRDDETRPAVMAAATSQIAARTRAGRR
jgi:hypothetical protein